jgi:hypothetical protein
MPTCTDKLTGVVGAVLEAVSSAGAGRLAALGRMLHDAATAALLRCRQLMHVLAAKERKKERKRERKREDARMRG